MMKKTAALLLMLGLNLEAGALAPPSEAGFVSKALLSERVEYRDILENKNNILNTFEELILATPFFHSRSPFKIFSDAAFLGKEHIEPLKKLLGNDSGRFKILVEKLERLGSFNLPHTEYENRISDMHIFYLFLNNYYVPLRQDDASHIAKKYTTMFNTPRMSEWILKSKKEFMEILASLEELLTEIQRIAYEESSKHQTLEDIWGHYINISSFAHRYLLLIKGLSEFLQYTSAEGMEKKGGTITDLDEWLNRQWWFYRSSRFFMDIRKPDFIIPLDVNPAILAAGIDQLISIQPADPDNSDSPASPRTQITMTTEILSHDKGEKKVLLGINIPSPVDDDLKAFLQNLTEQGNAEQRFGLCKPVKINNLKADFGIGTQFGIYAIQKMGGTVLYRPLEDGAWIGIEFPLAKDIRLVKLINGVPEQQYEWLMKIIRLGKKFLDTHTHKINKGESFRGKFCQVYSLGIEAILKKFGLRCRVYLTGEFEPVHFFLYVKKHGIILDVDPLGRPKKDGVPFIGIYSIKHPAGQSWPLYWELSDKDDSPLAQRETYAFITKRVTRLLKTQPFPLKELDAVNPFKHIEITPEIVGETTRSLTISM